MSKNESLHKVLKALLRKPLSQQTLQLILRQKLIQRQYLALCKL